MHIVNNPREPPQPAIGFEQFAAVDIRMGTIIDVESFPEARKPALKLKIDFGPGVGIKRSSAQITRHYDVAALIGRQVAAVVNFPPRQIGKFMSDVLTLGFPDERRSRFVQTGPGRSQRGAVVLRDEAEPLEAFGKLRRN
jgi:tRNA-binding protein